MTRNKPRFRGLFITGTDTGIGKTRIALGLMESLKKKGIKVCAMKPVATGCYAEKDGLRNEDALLLQSHACRAVDYSLLNPYAFAPPIAPHIAAQQAGQEICLASIKRCYDALQAQSGFVVVEGIGGWEVPLNSKEGVSDLARILGLPVLLVVGLRLGCLNHALLTSAAIQASGCELIGWIGNRIDPDFSHAHENMASLKSRIRAPTLGFVGFDPASDPARIADSLKIDDWMVG